MEHNLRIKMKQTHSDKRAYYLFNDDHFVACLEIDTYKGFVALEDVTTFKLYRRQGFMRWLIGEVRKCEDSPTMRLLVYPDNKPAIKLYRSLGFRFTRDGVYRKALGARCVNPDDTKILEKLPEMVWAPTQQKELKMSKKKLTQKQIRALFPDMRIDFNDNGFDVIEPGTGRMAAALHDCKPGIFVELHKQMPKGRSSILSIAELKSFTHRGQLEYALNADRRLEGKGSASEAMVERHWKAVLRDDFETCTNLLANFLAGRELVYPADLPLTPRGRREYRQMRKVPAAPKPYTGPHGWNEAIRDMYQTEDQVMSDKAPTPPPVAQLTHTLQKGEAQRENASKRTVWSAEDDAILELVEQEHRMLSMRLAELRVARTDNTSIPEWDRRHATSISAAEYRAMAQKRVEWISERSRSCSITIQRNPDGSYKCHRVTWYLKDAGWLSAEGSTWVDAIDNAMATVYDFDTHESRVEK